MFNLWRGIIVIEKTLEILMKNHNKANEYFQQALQMDLKDNNLGICLNNLVVNKLLLFNLE